MATPPGSSSAAMAYDAEDDVFYMIANSRELYCVSLVSDMAHANLIVDLADVGYPSGGLIDGMGWHGGPPSSCSADVAIPKDGNVNVVDLLDLLAAWGPCLPDCPTPCYADIDKSGTVNVVDLLDLLSQWGTCK